MVDTQAPAASQTSTTAAPAAAPVTQATATAAPIQSAATASPQTSSPAPAAAPTPAAQPSSWINPPAAPATTAATGTTTPADGKTATATPATTDPKADAAKAEAPKPVELKLPEKALASPKDVEAIQAFASEHKLTAEAAQKLLDATDARLKGYESGVIAKFEETTNQWMDTIRNDKDFGGAKFEASKEDANRAMLKYFDPEFIAELNRSKMGLHPGFFRGMARLGLEGREDTIKSPTQGSGSGASKELTHEQFKAQLYPSMHPPAT